MSREPLPFEERPTWQRVKDMMEVLEDLKRRIQGNPAITPEPVEPVAFISRQLSGIGQHTTMVGCHDCVARMEHPEPLSEHRLRGIGRLNCDFCQALLVAPSTEVSK